MRRSSSTAGSTTSATSAWSTTSTRRCARTSCSRATAATSARTARPPPWTSSPAARGRCGAPPRARTSEGLAHALEAKEAVSVQTENQTLASITYQTHFRLYPKLAGMTGTAMTEANEFAEIYKLEVVEIPTNVACVRIDADDEVYRTLREKTDAIVALVEECRARQQPMLVGTVSIEKSEALSAVLKEKS